MPRLCAQGDILIERVADAPAKAPAARPGSDGSVVVAAGGGRGSAAREAIAWTEQYYARAICRLGVADIGGINDLGRNAVSAIRVVQSLKICPRRNAPTPDRSGRWE